MCFIDPSLPQQPPFNFFFCISICRPSQEKCGNVPVCNLLSVKRLIGHGSSSSGIVNIPGSFLSPAVRLYFMYSTCCAVSWYSPTTQPRAHSDISSQSAPSYDWRSSSAQTQPGLQTVSCCHTLSPRLRVRCECNAEDQWRPSHRGERTGGRTLQPPLLMISLYNTFMIWPRRDAYAANARINNTSNDKLCPTRCLNFPLNQQVRTGIAQQPQIWSLGKED